MPLVLLHALPLDSTMWDGVREELKDLDILTFDAPGFGESAEWIPEGEPNTKEFVEAIKARLDELGIKKIALGGLSMGGSVAADFTVAHPEYVAGLALMDTGIGKDPEERVAFRRGMADAAERGEGYEAVKGWTTTMVAKNAPTEIRESLDARFKALPNAGLAWIQRAMANRGDSTKAVGLVEGPVYFVRGEDDPTASMEMFMKQALDARDPRIIEIENAGHFSADEQPAELAKILREFYERTQAAQN